MHRVRAATAGWLAGGLRARITLGEWIAGTALPPEALLAKAYGVALGTLRQALALLVAEGLLERPMGAVHFFAPGWAAPRCCDFFVSATPAICRQRPGLASWLGQWHRRA